MISGASLLPAIGTTTMTPLDLLYLALALAVAGGVVFGAKKLGLDLGSVMRVFSLIRPSKNKGAGK